MFPQANNLAYFRVPSISIKEVKKPAPYLIPSQFPICLLTAMQLEKQITSIKTVSTSSFLIIQASAVYSTK